MPIILQIETSTDVCSVALCKDGLLLYLSESEVANSHTEKLTLLIQECMVMSGYKYNQLDAIAISSGPGSYTSLRIGAATAKGICYAIDKPLITLDSLTILAHGIENLALRPNDVIIPMIDARRMEVYTAIYDKDMTIKEGVHALILDEHSFINYTGKKHLCGSGAEKFSLNYPKEDHVLHHRVTSAKYMNELALLAFDQKIFSDVAYFTPQYFKAPNITKSTKKIF